jgi:hypothetical protein
MDKETEEKKTERGEGRREDKQGFRVRKCKRKDCEDTFATKKELNQHMVAKHHYLPCTHHHCSKVFMLQSRLDRHLPTHRQPLPTLAPSQAPASRPQTAAESAADLTQTTVAYLRAVASLMQPTESKGTAFAQFTAGLLSGVALRPAFTGALALYLHALEVAFNLPSASTLHHTQETPISLPVYTNQTDIPASNAISIPISSLLPLTEQTNAPGRGKGFVFQLHTKGLKRKRRKTERFAIDEEEYLRYKRKKTNKVVVLPEEQPFLPPPLPPSELELLLNGSKSLICIEEPCDMRFCTSKELLKHLELAHYHSKACN